MYILIRLIIPQNPQFGTGTDTICAILHEIYVKHQSYGKKWPPGGDLEPRKFVNILRRLVIPQNPPFGTGTDALCAILHKIYVKNIKVTGKNGRQAAILNRRSL